MTENDPIRQKQRQYLLWVKSHYNTNWSAIAKAIGVSASTINRFMREPHGNRLNAKTMDGLLSVYGQQPELEAVTVCPPVPVVGTIQAGVWRTGVINEHPTEFIPVVPDHRYPGAQRMAFRVVGDSMNLLYPEGTTVIAVSPYDIGRDPKSGEKVVVIRQTDGVQEATLKQIEITEDGAVILWPRSTNPDHSQAIKLPNIPDLHEFPDNGCHEEYRIAGIVIQSIRPE